MKKRDYAGSSQKMAGNEQITSEVAKNPNGIGYVGLRLHPRCGYQGCLDRRPIAEQGKHPKEGLSLRSYPDLLYTNGEPTGKAKFVEPALSDAGQKIAEKIGFVAIR